MLHGVKILGVHSPYFFISRKGVGCEKIKQITIWKIRDRRSNAVIYTCKEDYAQKMREKGYIINAEIKRVLG